MQRNLLMQGKFKAQLLSLKFTGHIITLPRVVHTSQWNFEADLADGNLKLMKKEGPAHV